MVVVHSLGHYMDVPVERLKFDPDPLGLTPGEYECPCPACQLKRRLAELHAQGVAVAVPPQAVVQPSVSPDIQPLSGPLITAFDVHGAGIHAGDAAPERKSPERAAAESQLVQPQLVTSDGRSVPRWLVLLVQAVVWCAAIPLWPVVWLGTRRPRLRIARETR